MNIFWEYHRRYISKIAGIIIISSALLIGLNYYSIKILSSIRAYVNGESEYSKSQKDATRYLIDFIETSDAQSYASFREELSVPIGDSLLRVALQNKASYQVIRKAALQGKNHPDDIDNLIWLFRMFENVSYFKAIIDKWTIADADIGEMDKIGRFIYNLKNEELNPSVKTALILNVNTINRRLTNSEQAFSAILGEASRKIAFWLIIINVFFILLILMACGMFAKSMFTQLLESRKLILAQNRAKDEFMSIASHELKTPITSMKASLQILGRIVKDHPEGRAMHPFIMNSNKQVNRLTELVKDLLDVTKIQSGKLVINKKPFLLNQLVKEVIEETTMVSDHKYEIGELPPIYVNADASRIYQVIDNLLSNAAKYSSNADQIHISSDIWDNNIRINVRDFGPGISANKLPYLFDRFYRIEETTQTVQGLGLGLYICKEIIKNHGGEIGAESEVGKGSVFWFSLPVLKVLESVESAA